MPRKCTICQHPQRDAIDKAIVACEPLREIAQRFKASPNALWRHKTHVLQVLVKAKDAADVADANDLLGRLLDLNRETMAILREARSGEPDNELALKAIARAEKQLELQARLLGQLGEGTTTVNVLAVPEWSQVQTMIVGALEGFPEARAAVVRALQAGDG